MSFTKKGVHFETIHNVKARLPFRKQTETNKQFRKNKQTKKITPTKKKNISHIT